MFGLKKKHQSGLIQGQGTGTSDSIKKDIAVGSYIMPADSTQQLGVKQLEQMGKGIPTVEANVSNGEYELPPEQVHAIGMQTLDQLKQATHTPVAQQQGLGLNQQSIEQYKQLHQAKHGGNFGFKPELFFADGTDEDTWTGMDTATAIGLGSALAYKPAKNALTNVAQVTNLTGGATQGTAGHLVRTGLSNAKLPQSVNFAQNTGKLVKAGTIGALGATAVQGFNTDTEQYRDRFGLQTDNPTLAGDMGVRALGIASDLGNTLSLGLAGKFYQDKSMNKWQQPTTDNTAMSLASTQATQTQAKPTSVPTATTTQPQVTQNDNTFVNRNAQVLASNPNFAQTVGYGFNPEVRQQYLSKQNPFAIKQVGHSFSYADPNAAAEAMARGERWQGSGSGVIQPIQAEQATTQGLGLNPEIIQRFAVQHGSKPIHPQRTEQQEAERNAVMSQVLTPIKGARGLTANQLRTLSDLQQGEDNRANQRYITDANNANQMSQVMLREHGTMQRQALDEQGKHNRFNAELGFNQHKFDAQQDLERQEFGLKKAQANIGFNKESQLQRAYQLFDTAKTAEEQAYAKALIARYGGTTGEQQTAQGLQGKDRYMVIGGGQEWNDKAMAMVNKPQQLFDTATGQLVNLNGQQGNQRREQFEQQLNEYFADKPVGATMQVNGKTVYKQPDGTLAVLDK